MNEQMDIITQLNLKLTHAIAEQNAGALNHLLAEFTKTYQAFAIYEFHGIIKCHILEHTNGDFLAQKPIAREKMLVLRWLESTLKNSPYQLSIMLTQADIALYKNQSDKASKLFRQVLMLYINFLKENNLSISSVHSWNWMLKYAVLIELPQIEGEPYSFAPLQLPESLINKAPQTIVTLYGNTPYVRQFATRTVSSVAELMPEVDILLVVGNQAQDTDAETDQLITALQQTYPQLHIAYDMIPDIFQQKHLLYTYCASRRFTYLQDILQQSACRQLVSIDIDCFIQPVFKTCVNDGIDAPIGYKCDDTAIFGPENLIAADYFKIDNTEIGQKFLQTLYDYISKKFGNQQALWFVDQYALFHAWQNALTAEQQQKCYHINQCNTDEIDIQHLHIGATQEEHALYIKERDEKIAEDSRLSNIIMPQDIDFAEQTLRPILSLDWNK